MNRHLFETLEQRQLLSAAVDAAVESAYQWPRSASQHEGVRDPSDKANLTAAEVETILGQAASQARRGQVIVVMDDEGVMLGIYAMAGSNDNRAPNGTNFPPTGRFSERE